ncbi:MAG TPA: heme-binding protein [Usitatibacter sp.]|nr:heme-binding protein [Usitatibacter sp.]
MNTRRAVAASALAAMAACSGGGGGSSPSTSMPPPPANLTVEDVQRVIAQAVGEAQARGLAGHVAVVDRVGNVLAIFRMTGALPTVTISSGLGVTGGLEGAEVPAAAAALSKAITAAYLSSNGNAFTPRTASQIVQEHFNPGEQQQPSGPLYGVQYSQLQCSDVNADGFLATLGPRPSPLGLSADPGAVPLYKAGVLVGAVGVEVDGRYGIDRAIFDLDTNIEEAIALAGSFRFEVPADIRAERITADGRTFRFVDATGLVSDPASAAPLSLLPGMPVGLPGYNAGLLVAGTAYGTSASGVVRGNPDPGGRWILVDAFNLNRYPPRDGTDLATSPVHLTAVEVDAVLAEAYAIARRARAQIRRPLGSAAEVTISIVDTNGTILGLVRTPDAPIFGIDVAVQKARTAMFFSHPDAAKDLASAHLVLAPDGAPTVVGAYADALATFGVPLDGSVAWSSRAIGNIHRPTFPDGIEGTPPGPLSTPLARWSPFNVGLQLDLIFNQLLKAVGGSFDRVCAGRRSPLVPPILIKDFGIGKIANGIQIFPGGVPIYRGNELVGAIGVSGDGVDQDDMIAFLGLANAGRRLATGIGNAPPAMRADRFTPLGTRLRYVQCPQSPFNDSSEQNVCAGL